MVTKKPKMKQTVGAQYYAFNTPDTNGNFSSTYEDTIKTETVKSIGTTENGDNTTVKASGKDYATVNSTQNVEMEVENVAFDPDDLARMRGETIDNSGLVTSGHGGLRPFFAYGKVVKKFNDGFRYEWFPKCQLVENTDDINTEEDSFSEQNDTVTVRAYPFNEAGDVKTYVDSDMTKFPENLTEDKFFDKPILTPADLTAATTAGA